jgi:hypothetical protein
MTISIEQDPPRTTRCDCCGGLTTNLMRFVFRDGDAYAVYYAAFSDNHADGIISVLIGLGEWGDEASPDDRTGFALQIRLSNGDYQVMIVDPERSPWTHAALLGRILNRDEALVHPLVQEVFQLTDHIVHHDTEVHQYLERGIG